MNNKKKVLLTIGMTVFALLLAIAVTALLLYKPVADRYIYSEEKQLQLLGLSISEVERILGPPDVSEGENYYWGEKKSILKRILPDEQFAVALSVCFGNDGLACDVDVWRQNYP